MTNKQRIKQFQMKHTLSNVVKDNIIDCMQLGHIRQTVGYIARDITFDTDKESPSEVSREVWWTVRNSVCLPTRASIIQKLK